MREILIAEKTATGCDVLLLCVSALKLLPGDEARCWTNDNIAITVKEECVHLIGGTSEMEGMMPESDGLFALSRDGRWLEARRQ